MEGNRLPLEERKEIEQQILAIKERRKKYKDDPIIGRRVIIRREKKKSVEVIIHQPKNVHSDREFPIYFNMHGGGFLAGDAGSMETFCSNLCNELEAIVVNVNYTKVDEETFPYATEEVVDIVHYFIKNNEQYLANTKKIVVGGFSAGGQIAATAALQLKKEGVKLAGQLLCYPCVSLVLTHDENLDNLMKMFIQYFFPEGGNEESNFSPLYATNEELRGLASTIMIVCGLDDLKPSAVEYSKRLIDVGVPLKFKEYSKAYHGFIEVNQPEHSPREGGQSVEQKKLCIEAMNYLVMELKNCFLEASE